MSCLGCPDVDRTEPWVCNGGFGTQSHCEYDDFVKGQKHMLSLLPWARLGCHGSATQISTARVDRQLFIQLCRVTMQHPWSTMTNVAPAARCCLMAAPGPYRPSHSA